MPASRATMGDLKSQISELAERHRNLKDHETFVLWFLLASVTGSQHDATGAIKAAAWPFVTIICGSVKIPPAGGLKLMEGNEGGQTRFDSSVGPRRP